MWHAHEIGMVCLSLLMPLIKYRGSDLINEHKVHDHPTLYVSMSLLCMRYIKGKLKYMCKVKPPK